MKRLTQAMIATAFVLLTASSAFAGYDRVTCDSGYTEIPDVGVCRRDDGQHVCPIGFDGYDLHVDDNVPNDGWGCFCQSGYTQFTSTGMGTFSNHCVMPPVPATPALDLTSCDTRAYKPHGISMTGICYADCSKGMWTPACTPAVWWQHDHQVYVGSQALLYRDRLNTKLYLYNDWNNLSIPCGYDGFWWDNLPGGSNQCEGGWTAPLVFPGVPAPQTNASWYQFKWN